MGRRFREGGRKEDGGIASKNDQDAFHLYKYQFPKMRVIIMYHGNINFKQFFLEEAQCHLCPHSLGWCIHIAKPELKLGNIFCPYQGTGRIWKRTKSYDKQFNWWHNIILILSNDGSSLIEKGIHVPELVSTMQAWPGYDYFKVKR